MKLTTLIKRLVLSVGATSLLLIIASVSANAMTVHLCEGGLYSITTISVVPGPNGTYRHVSTTTNMGKCEGEWTYNERLGVASGGNTIQVFEEKGQLSLGNIQVKQLPLASSPVQAILAGWRAGTPKRPFPTKQVFLTDDEARREIARLEKLPSLRIVLPLSGLTVPRMVPVGRYSTFSQ